MQDDVNQTNQKDPDNRGQFDFEYTLPGFYSIWLAIIYMNYKTIVSFFCKSTSIAQGVNRVVILDKIA